MSQALYTKTNGGSIKACQLFSVKKIFEKILLFPRHIELNLVMSLKRLSVEAWQNEKHYSTGNNTSKNPIPRQEISNQSTMYSGHVRSGHNIVVCAVFLLSFQAVVLSCNYTRNLSATILFKLVDSYLIAFKFAQ